MKDITSVSEGSGGDLFVQESVVNKAANVLQIPLGSLEYAPEFGIDLAFFLDEKLRFQNESFKAYLIQRLAESHVNVAGVTDLLERFSRQYTFTVGEEEGKTGGMIQ